MLVMLSGGQSSSAAPMRAKYCGNSSALHCVRRSEPLVIVSQAKPHCFLPGTMASKGASWRSLINAESVTVPGVITRTTRRSTGPLEVAGSPICSAIATDSPCLTSLARYCSAA